MKKFAILCSIFAVCAAFAQSAQIAPQAHAPTQNAESPAEVNNQNTTSTAQSQIGQEAQQETKADDPVAKDSEEEQNPLVQKLLENNPFGNGFATSQSTDTPNALPEPPQGVELRAIYCVDNKWYFSVADTKLKTSYTIRLGAKKTDSIPYEIDFFDDETNSVSISNDLGSYTLSLKEQDRPTGAVPNMVASANINIQNSKTKLQNNGGAQLNAQPAVMRPQVMLNNNRNANANQNADTYRNNQNNSARNRAR